MGRRLGEMLFGVKALQADGRIGIQSLAQGRGLFVLILHVDLLEALKNKTGGGDGEELDGDLSLRGLPRDPDLGGLIAGGAHAAGDETLPDQLIEPVLLAGEGLPDRRRQARDIGGPDRLVGVLDLAVLFLFLFLLQEIFGSVGLLDKGGRGGLGLVRDADTVRAQIGDQGDRALSLDLDALVELLGDPHGLLGGEVQDAAGLLLEGGGRKRKGGLARPFGPLHFADGEGRTIQAVHDPHGLLPYLQVDAGGFSVRSDLSVIACLQGLFAAGSRKGGLQGPVFLGNEGIDFILAVPDHAQGDGLDTAGGQAPLDLGPQKGRNLIAHHAVQDAAGLLGIHQVHIELPGVFQRLGDGFFGDLVEGDPGDLLVLRLVELEGGLQVPGDRLSLAVRVRCQIDPVRLFDKLAQSRQELALAADGDVLGLVIVLDVDPHLALGQVADVSVGRGHLVAGPQKFLDRLYLGR